MGSALHVIWSVFKSLHMHTHLNVKLLASFVPMIWYSMCVKNWWLVSPLCADTVPVHDVILCDITFSSLLWQVAFSELPNKPIWFLLFFSGIILTWSQLPGIVYTNFHMQVRSLRLGSVERFFFCVGGWSAWDGPPWPIVFRCYCLLQHYAITAVLRGNQIQIYIR